MRQVRILDALGARWSDQPPEAIAEAAAAFFVGKKKCIIAAVGGDAGESSCR